MGAINCRGWRSCALVCRYAMCPTRQPIERRGSRGGDTRKHAGLLHDQAKTGTPSDGFPWRLLSGGDRRKQALGDWVVGLGHGYGQYERGLPYAAKVRQPGWLSWKIHQCLPVPRGHLRKPGATRPWLACQGPEHQCKHVRRQRQRVDLRSRLQRWRSEQSGPLQRRGDILCLAHSRSGSNVRLHGRASRQHKRRRFMAAQFEFERADAPSTRHNACGVLPTDTRATSLESTTEEAETRGIAVEELTHDMACLGSVLSCFVFFPRNNPNAASDLRIHKTKR